MHFFDRVKPRFPQLLGLGLMLVALLAVACGGTAAPTTAPPAAQATEAPQAAAQPTEASAGDAPPAAAQPTAVPAPTSPPVVASPEVNPGKVTWMVGSFSNERMHYCLAGGGGHDYGRQLHAFVISSDVKDGARVLIPGVASDWELSADGQTLVMTIREGVKFHDGTEVTPEDVRWNFQFAMGPEARDYATGGACLTASQITPKIEQTGPNQVSVSRNEPFPGWPDFVSEAFGNWIGTVHPAGLGGDPATIHDEATEAAYDKNPIGAGIFKMVKHIASESMEMERFADHYYQPDNGFDKDRRPKFTTLDMRLVPEVATRVAALRSGEADFAPVSLGARSQVEAGGGHLVFGQEGVYFYAAFLGTWDDRFPTFDKRVRQALNYTVDRANMRDKLYQGSEVMQVKGFLAVTPSTRGYSPELDPFPFDPDKGRELMIAAGYKVPGSPEGKDFGKLIINTWPSASTPNIPDAAQFTAQVWKKELGIDAEVRVSEEAAVKKLTRLTDDALGQVLFRDNETRLDASFLFNSTFGANPERPTNGSRDPEINEIARKARVITDPVEREKAYNAAFLRFREESNLLSLGYVNIPWGVGPRILTWEPFPLAFYPSSMHTITLK